MTSQAHQLSTANASKRWHQRGRTKLANGKRKKETNNHQKAQQPRRQKRQTEKCFFSHHLQLFFTQYPISKSPSPFLPELLSERPLFFVPPFMPSPFSTLVDQKKIKQFVCSCSQQFS
jgi:hypothetical protein